MVQTCNLMNYPKNVAKDVAITGYVGRRGSSMSETDRNLLENESSLIFLAKASHFCGQIGTIHFLSGVMDQESVKKVYQRGSLWNPESLEENDGSFFGNSLESFLTLRPSAYLLSEANRYGKTLYDIEKKSNWFRLESQTSIPSTHSSGSLPNIPAVAPTSPASPASTTSAPTPSDATVRFFFIFSENNFL